MAFENNAAPRSGTPLSGRSTPVNRFRGQGDDDINFKDKAARRYAAGVDRALTSFETTQQEWADYISFLGRLHKALQARPEGSHTVPYAETIATRLAQCLNPTLPSGVHQKALELYSYIFSVYQTEVLAHKLRIFLPGLSPVLSFASLSVRPYFLSILEDHVFPLGESALRPALKALILSLLPGLEDESSEDFERVLETLDALRKGPESGARPDSVSFFWQCFFLATLSSPSRRQGSLAFLVRKLPKLGAAPTGTVTTGTTSTGSRALAAESRAVTSPEPGLLIRCFAAGLGDRQLLVQRGFLDLLVTHLPLHAAVLQTSVTADDLQELLSAATSVVLRRDMSLNRRLWRWLLGPEPKETTATGADIKSSNHDHAASESAYFSQYGLQALTQSLLSMIHLASDNAMTKAKPFRICLSLMDRWEVGGLVIPSVFGPAMECVYSYSLVAEKTKVDEMIKSVGIFFDGIESALIWGKMLHLLQEAISDKALPREKRLKNLEICAFIIRHFNLREEEMVELHIPLVVLATLIVIRAQTRSEETMVDLEPEVLSVVFENLERLTLLIDMKSTRLADKASESLEDSAEAFDLLSERLASIKQFYIDEQQGFDGAEPPLTSSMLFAALSAQSTDLFLGLLKQARYEHCLPTLAQIHSNIIQRVDKESLTSSSSLAQNNKRFLQLLKEHIMERRKRKNSDSFTSISAILQCFLSTKILTKDLPAHEHTMESDIAHDLTELLWLQLAPLKPKFHIEIVQCFYSLINAQLSGSPVESAVTKQILEAFVLDETLANTSRSVVHPGVSRTRVLGPEVADGIIADTLRRYHLIWMHYPSERQAGESRKLRAMQRRASAMSPSDVISGGNPVMPKLLSQPLMLLLDEFSGENPKYFDIISAWLQHLPDLHRVFAYLIGRIMSLRCLSQQMTESLTTVKDDQSDRPSKTISQLVHDDLESPTPLSLAREDEDECAYHLDQVMKLLRLGTSQVWTALCVEIQDPFQNEADIKQPGPMGLQQVVATLCLQILRGASPAFNGQAQRLSLQNYALNVLQTLLQSPIASHLLPLRLDEVLTEKLVSSIGNLPLSIERSLLKATTLALQAKDASHIDEPSHGTLIRPESPRQLSLNTGRKPQTGKTKTSALLVDCLKKGFSTSAGYVILDDWVDFLTAVLPLFADAIFQSLIPLVETFCKQIKVVFHQLRSTFASGQSDPGGVPETTLIGLMNGLERLLASAHERLTIEEQQLQDTKTPEQTQSFFGSMVQGVFAADAATNTRSSTANSRLTVVLCFQDTVRSCYEIWSWGLDSQIVQDTASSASFAYTSLRMRNRARRLLEHLFAAEALECLEALVVLWCKQAHQSDQSSSVIALLNVLSGAKPKYTFPAIFNAVYSRINSISLESTRMSSLTSELTDLDLTRFLVTYTQSVDDDAIDEVWTNCLIFLKDVLANPLPHRQILPSLLYLLTEIAEKVDRTNFGEQKRMRKELADHFLRVLTATFTTRPQGLFSDQPSQGAQRSLATPSTRETSSRQPMDILAILVAVVQRLPFVLGEAERMNSAIQTIFANAISPLLRAKTFPANVSEEHLDLLVHVTKLSQASKVWRKDVNEASNDPKFFDTAPDLVKGYWLTIIKQLSNVDKERFAELLARLSPPTTAGIVFGVGASSARAEADRKTQLNLRRIAISILANPQDAFVAQLGVLEEKVVELFNATNVSSPSANTWSEVFLVIRVVLLKNSPIHVAPLWPLINKELQSALLSIVETDGDGGTKYNNATLIQACKLLDTVIALGTEDFQIYEWLYITDTIDAVYRPANVEAVSLTDELADVLNTAADSTSTMATVPSASSTAQESSGRKHTPPFDAVLEGLSAEYDAGDLRSMPRQELVLRVLRPYFGQLSLLTFEATYACKTVDVDECIDSVVKDLHGGYTNLDG